MIRRNDSLFTRRSFLQGSAAFAGIGLSSFLTPLPVFGAASRYTEAKTTAGRIRGIEKDGIHIFKGIPYGADTAQRRFQAPVPPTPWKDVRDALDFGPRAPQLGGPSRGRTIEPMPTSGYHLPPDLGETSEDCLHLNVWTPALRDKGKRPVLVYIHGGAYNNGTVNCELYDGTRLCKRGDVVVVTVNHRLNAFGYLYLAELGGEAFADSGNAGMLDLVLALEWVRDNIEEFGGDPQRVLIFGQSGGGAKCATLMAMPKAKGLFHRVITMSGQQITGSRPEAATNRAKALLSALNLPLSRIDEIRTMPIDKLTLALRAANYYGPVRDGRALPRDPFDPDAPALSANIPMMLGNTHDETRGLIGGGAPELFSLTWEEVPEKLKHFAGQFFGNLDLKEVVAKYKEIYPGYSPSDVFFAATTAFRSWRGQVIEADRRAAQPASASPTYVYELDWASPIDGGKWKAPHTLDIPFAFDNVAVAGRMCGTGKDAQEMANIMSETWIAFARTGNPNHAHLPHWPAFTLEERETMIFDRKSHVEKDPRGEERRLANRVTYTQPGTF